MIYPRTLHISHHYRDAQILLIHIVISDSDHIYAFNDCTKLTQIKRYIGSTSFILNKGKQFYIQTRMIMMIIYIQ